MDGTAADLAHQVHRIFRDEGRLGRLLALEKQRRGIPMGKLVFVGMHNVAQHWWCTQQAVFKSRANEGMFFATSTAFAQVDAGAPARPPSVDWKCRICEFQETCPISLV